MDSNDEAHDLNNNTDQPSVLSNDHTSDMATTDSTSSNNVYPTDTSNSNISMSNTDFNFSTKGLHIANLNKRQILPKFDELQIILGTANSPDRLGIFETFLDQPVSDNQPNLSD